MKIRSMTTYVGFFFTLHKQHLFFFLRLPFSLLWVKASKSAEVVMYLQPLGSPTCQYSQLLMCAHFHSFSESQL